MKALIPIILPTSHRSVIEMQQSIRENTYRSLGYSVGIAALAAALMTLLVMMSTSRAIDPVFTLPSITETLLINNKPEVKVPSVSEHHEIKEIAFIRQMDTITHEPLLSLIPAHEVMPSSSTTISPNGVFSSTPGVSSSASSTATSTSSSVTHPTDPSADDEEIVFAEVEPSVDLRALQSRVEYPAFLQRLGVSGEVRIAVLVSETGAVGATKILQSSDERFSAAALSAVLRTTFSPGKNNGIAAKSWVVIPITFSIR